MQYISRVKPLLHDQIFFDEFHMSNVQKSWRLLQTDVLNTHAFIQLYGQMFLLLVWYGLAKSGKKPYRRVDVEEQSQKTVVQPQVIF